MPHCKTLFILLYMEIKEDWFNLLNSRNKLREIKFPTKIVCILLTSPFLLSIEKSEFYIQEDVTSDGEGGWKA